MSSELPALNTRDVIRAFCRAGYVQLAGRGKGSHVALAAPDGSRILIIPGHGDVKRGTLRALIRQAGMTVEQFRGLT
jgi:predicted RNA binding protein YcfA (HicA-like mRNA interferase family)